MSSNFVSFVSEVGVLKSNQMPYIIFMTEIWIFDNEVNFHTINDHNCHAKWNNGYQADGVLILSLKDINCLVSSISLNLADISNK